MTNRARVIFATVAVMVVVLGLLYANQRAAHRAGDISAVIGAHVFQSMDALHRLRFGVARIVSSTNELIVLSASRTGSAAGNIPESEREQQLVEEGHAIFVTALDKFKKSHTSLAGANVDAYQTLIAEIEKRYAALIEITELISEDVRQSFDPKAVATLKEQFEGREQDVLRAIQTIISIGNTDSRRLIVEELAPVHQMKNNTIALAGVFALVLLIYSIFVFRVLSREESARLTAEQSTADLDRALNEKKQEMVKRVELEKTLSHAHKVESVGTLAGGMAHDFNNLLGITMGNLEVLKRLTGDDKSLGKYIDTALKNTQRGAELTKRLLRFARKNPRRTATVSINTLIEDMGELIAKSLTETIDFKFDLGSDLWLTEIDPGDFTDVLVNLIINARDAMPTGGRLTVKTANVVLGPDHAFMIREIVPGDYVMMTVADTGTGIEEELIERIFEPFFTTKDNSKGTGLGLSMVYGFVNRSAGDIAVDTDPGRGVTFRIYLPRATGNVPVVAPDEDGVGRSFYGTETVLLVDDEEKLLEISAEYLKQLGYRTLTATDGVSALEVLRGSENIDLLFSDVVMAGDMNGFQLAEKAVGIDPGLRVLVTSGFVDTDALKKAGINFTDEMMKQFSSNLLPKPYSQHALASCVRKILDRKDSDDEPPFACR